MHTHLPLIKRLGLSREIRAAALAFCAVFVTGIYGRAASVSEPFSYTITATGSQSVVSYPAQGVRLYGDGDWHRELERNRGYESNQILLGPKLHMERGRVFSVHANVNRKGQRQL